MLKNTPGFTLIEILIAVVVLAIGCLAAIAMQSSAMEGGVQAYNLTVASFLAESEIERLQSLPRNSVVNNEENLTRNGESCQDQPQEPCYRRVVVVTPNHPTRNSVGLTVTVTPPGRGGPVVYETFITYLNLN